MFTVELHCPQNGSMLPTLNSRIADIEDVAKSLKAMGETTVARANEFWTRAYVLEDNKLKAIVARLKDQERTLQYVAFVPGQPQAFGLQLPQVYGSAGLAVSQLDTDMTPAKAAYWATTSLKKSRVVAACLLVEGRIAAAYEQIGGQAKLRAVSSELLS